MSNEYTEEEKKLADEIRQDMNDGKRLIDINAKRRQLNRLYAKRREEATQEMGYRIDLQGTAFLRVCGTCDGSGGVDSGGVTPWGEGITVGCPECEIFRANGKDHGHE